MRLLPQKPLDVSDRTVRRVWIFVVALTVVVVLGMLFWLVRLSNDGEADDRAIAELAADRAKLSQRLDAQEKTSAEHKEASIALAEQVERLGGKPVVDPGEPATPIPSPVVVPQAQVNEAVSVICTGTPACRPTEAQVKTTLRAICGDCRGEDAEPPRDGIDGTNGQNATITAEQIDAAVARNCGEDGCRGPGPTDEQVDERLAAYCSQRDDCKGESVQGEKGETGSVTPGDYACPDGEYVTKISVTAEGSMVLACATPSLLGKP